MSEVTLYTLKQGVISSDFDVISAQQRTANLYQAAFNWSTVECENQCVDIDGCHSHCAVGMDMDTFTLCGKVL